MVDWFIFTKLETNTARNVAYDFKSSLFLRETNTVDVEKSGGWILIRC